MGTLDLQVTTQLRSFRLDLGLSRPPGVLALVGPSGAGKSTVLRAIAGLHTPDDGRIALEQDVWFDAARGINLAPERRAVGMVFQEYALFPHLSVADNVGFGGRERVAELLDRLAIADLGDARVDQISGGERQRVALARALSRNPQVLLLDEPLAALDTHTRARVRTELGPLLQEFGLPTLLVTHDFADAAALADEVAVVVDGELRQRGTPFELTAAPADPFVASFTGAALIAVTVSGSEIVLRNGARLAAPPDAPRGPALMAVYPWEAELGTHGLDATVTAIAPNGGTSRVQTDVMPIDVTPAAAAALAAGDGVRISIPARVRRLYRRA